MSRQNKTASSSLGARNRCINLVVCPLCYGCRNYSSVDPDCEACLKDNKKYNICDTEKHKSELISRFVQRTKIQL